MRTWVLFSLLAVTVAWTATAAPGKALTARQIMEKTEELHKCKSEVEHQSMLLVDKSGNQEKRSLRRYNWDQSEKETKFLIVFLEPKDVRGTSLLTWQHCGAQDDQWLYLPAVGKKLQRIAKGSKKGAFMGTDFTYEDLSAEELDEFDYTTVKEETVDGQPCWVIESKPKTPEAKKESGYGRRVLWVRQDIFFPVKIEFYNQRDKHVKTQSFLEIEKVQGTVHRAKKALMDNHKDEHKTYVLVSHREINSKVDPALFTEEAVLKGSALQ